MTKNKPYEKYLGRIHDFDVWVVDGEWVRNNLDVDFSSYGQPLKWSFIPDGEIWIDHEEYPNDWIYYVPRMLVENKLMQKGIDFDSAHQISSFVEEHQRARKQFPDRKVDPKISKLETIGDLTVWLVYGKKVRDNLYVDFKEGGHDLVYKWIPPLEIWIDNDLKPNYRKDALAHELRERELMDKGWSYLAAHTQALARESEYRHLPLKKLKILQVPFTRQIKSFSCGAAALQSVLIYYDMPVKNQSTLIEQLGTTDTGGTLPEELVRVAKEYGLKGEVVENLDIEDLNHFTNFGVPVIVAYQAWQDKPKKPWTSDWDDGHYSCVMGVDNGNVYLDDPSYYGAVGAIKIDQFLKRWHDIDAKGKVRDHLGIVLTKEK